MNQQMGANELERATTGNFLESFSVKGSREMGHWLEGNRRIVGGFCPHVEGIKLDLYADDNDL